MIQSRDKMSPVKRICGRDKMSPVKRICGRDKMSPVKRICGRDKMSPVKRICGRDKMSPVKRICGRDKMSPVKRICVFEHSVITNFNCACPAIQRAQGSGFLFEGSSSLTAYMSEQRRFWRDCADAQARLNLRCSHRR